MKTINVYFDEIGCDWSLCGTFTVASTDDETNTDDDTLPTEDDVREMVKTINHERRILRDIATALEAGPDQPSDGLDQVTMG